MLENLRVDNIRLTGESGDDPQVAVVADVRAGTRKLRCLVLYFDLPEGVSVEKPLDKYNYDPSSSDFDHEDIDDTEDDQPPAARQVSPPALPFCQSVDSDLVVYDSSQERPSTSSSTSTVEREK